MEGAQSESADDQIRIVAGIDAEIAVVNAAAENRGLLRDTNDAIAVFDDARKSRAGIQPVSEGELFIKQVEPTRWLRQV
jgi:hypothetical protein